MRICILGATGLVGRETIELCQRAWPGADLALFASRDQKLELLGKTWSVSPAASLEAADAPKGELAFVALDDEHSARYVPRLLALGYRVVDKSNTFRADPNVPLVVGGVNSRRVTEDTNLVANPNCTTIPFMLATQPIARRFGLKSASVSTYQAVSGAGIAPLDEFLADAKRGYAEPDRFGAPFDALKYAGNTVPHHGKTDDSGFSAEERKLTFESRKILELPDLAISAQCCRVPVAVGHYMNAWITLGEKTTVGDLETVLGESDQTPFVRLHRGASGESMSALTAARDRDRAQVGRIRPDIRDDSGRSFCITVVGDNLRLGAATNAVRIATRWYPTADRDLQS